MLSEFAHFHPSIYPSSSRFSCCRLLFNTSEEKHTYLQRVFLKNSHCTSPSLWGNTFLSTARKPFRLVLKAESTVPWPVTCVVLNMQFIISHHMLSFIPQGLRDVELLLICAAWQILQGRGGCREVIGLELHTFRMAIMLIIHSTSVIVLGGGYQKWNITHI